MLVLKQNNKGFVNLDQVACVHVVKGCMGGRIEAVSAYGQHFWLGDYKTMERANNVLMELYAAKKSHYNDFIMPMVNPHAGDVCLCNSCKYDSTNAMNYPCCCCRYVTCSEMTQYKWEPKEEEE